MAEGTRPGGLTALAVLNFIYASMCALSVVGVLFVAAFVNSTVAEDGKGNDMSRGIEEAGGLGWFYAAGAVSGLFAVLLFIAGIGYLKQKRGMGRRIGSTYALVSIVFTLVYVVAVGMQFKMMPDLLYPLLTLILLNTTFKDDLVN